MLHDEVLIVDCCAGERDREEVPHCHAAERICTVTLSTVKNVICKLLNCIFPLLWQGIYSCHTAVETAQRTQMCKTMPRSVCVLPEHWYSFLMGSFYFV